MFPRRHLMTLLAMLCASGPLTLITDIAPVPGTVAGAHMVSSLRMYIVLSFKIAQNYHKYMYKAKFYLCKSAKFAYLRKDLRERKRYKK